MGSFQPGPAVSRQHHHLRRRRDAGRARRQPDLLRRYGAADAGGNAGKPPQGTLKWVNARDQPFGVSGSDPGICRGFFPFRLDGRRHAAFRYLAGADKFSRHAWASDACADAIHQHRRCGRARRAAHDDHRRALFQHAAHDARPCAGTKAGGHRNLRQPKHPLYR